VYLSHAVTHPSGNTAGSPLVSHGLPSPPLLVLIPEFESLLVRDGSSLFSLGICTKERRRMYYFYRLPEESVQNAMSLVQLMKQSQTRQEEDDRVRERERERERERVQERNYLQPSFMTSSMLYVPLDV